MLRISILLSCFSFCQLPLEAQICTETNFSFEPGEKVTYTAYYNWSFIWVDAGEVEFCVRDTTFNYEGGYEVKNTYHFDQECNKIYASIYNSDEPHQLDTLEYQPCIFDVMSVIYQSRNIDYNQYQENEKIPVSVILDGEIHHLYLRYLGKETIELKSKRKFKCIKFSPLLVEGTIFNGGEDMVVWVTDDLNRIPVLVEAKILVGSVKAVLNETTGLRNKILAEVFE